MKITLKTQLPEGTWVDDLKNAVGKTFEIDSIKVKELRYLVKPEFVERYED